MVNFFFFFNLCRLSTKQETLASLHSCGVSIIFKVFKLHLNFFGDFPLCWCGKHFIFLFWGWNAIKDHHAWLRHPLWIETESFLKRIVGVYWEMDWASNVLWYSFLLNVVVVESELENWIRLQPLDWTTRAIAHWSQPGYIRETLCDPNFTSTILTITT